MDKRNVLTIRIPEDLKYRIEKMAAAQGVSLNQFALYSFTKELAEIESSNFFKKHLKDKSKNDILNNFDKVMTKVKNKKVPKWDSMK